MGMYDINIYILNDPKSESLGNDERCVVGESQSKLFVTSKNASKTFTLRHNTTNFCTVNNVACYDMFPVGTTGIPPHPTSEQPE